MGIRSLLESLGGCGLLGVLLACFWSLLGPEVRASYNLFPVILGSCKTCSSMLRVGVTLVLMGVSMNVA